MVDMQLGRWLVKKIAPLIFIVWVKLLNEEVKRVRDVGLLGQWTDSIPP